VFEGVCVGGRDDTIFRRKNLIIYRLELHFLTNTVYHLKLELTIV